MSEELRASPIGFMVGTNRKGFDSSASLGRGDPSSVLILEENAMVLFALFCPRVDQRTRRADGQHSQEHTEEFCRIRDHSTTLSCSSKGRLRPAAGRTTIRRIWIAPCSPPFSFLWFDDRPEKKSRRLAEFCLKNVLFPQAVSTRGEGVARSIVSELGMALQNWQADLLARYRGSGSFDLIQQISSQRK